MEAGGGDQGEYGTGDLVEAGGGDQGEYGTGDLVEAGGGDQGDMSLTSRHGDQLEIGRLEARTRTCRRLLGAFNRAVVCVGAEGQWDRVATSSPSGTLLWGRRANVNIGQCLR